MINKKIFLIVVSFLVLSIILVLLYTIFFFIYGTNPGYTIQPANNILETSINNKFEILHCDQISAIGNYIKCNDLYVSKNISNNGKCYYQIVDCKKGLCMACDYKYQNISYVDVIASAPDPYIDESTHKLSFNCTHTDINTCINNYLEMSSIKYYCITDNFYHNLKCTRDYNEIGPTMVTMYMMGLTDLFYFGFLVLIIYLCASVI